MAALDFLRSVGNRLCRLPDHSFWQNYDEYAGA